MRLRRALLRRYQTVIDHIWYNRMLDLNQQLLAVYEDRMHLLDQNMGSMDFDIKKYMEADQKKSHLMLDLIRFLDLKQGSFSKYAASMLTLVQSLGYSPSYRLPAFQMKPAFV